VVQVPELFYLLSELLTAPDFDSRAVVTSFVRETVARMEAGFISSGTMAALRSLGVINLPISVTAAFAKSQRCPLSACALVALKFFGRIKTTYCAQFEQACHFAYFTAIYIY
jgi:hypothetical protein